MASIILFRNAIEKATSPCLSETSSDAIAYVNNKIWNQSVFVPIGFLKGRAAAVSRSLLNDYLFSKSEEDTRKIIASAWLSEDHKTVLDETTRWYGQWYTDTRSDNTKNIAVYAVYFGILDQLKKKESVLEASLAEFRRQLQALNLTGTVDQALQQIFDDINQRAILADRDLTSIRDMIEAIAPLADFPASKGHPFGKLEAVNKSFSVAIQTNSMNRSVDDAE